MQGHWAGSQAHHHSSKTIPFDASACSSTLTSAPSLAVPELAMRKDLTGFQCQPGWISRFHQPGSLTHINIARQRFWPIFGAYFLALEFGYVYPWFRMDMVMLSSSSRALLTEATAGWRNMTADSTVPSGSQWYPPGTQGTQAHLLHGYCPTICSTLLWGSKSSPLWGLFSVFYAHQHVHVLL